MGEIIIIGVTGLNCSGKDTVAEYLISKGFTHYSLSDAIRDELRKRDMPLTRENLQTFATQMRETSGNAVFAEKTLLKLEDGKDYVVTSIRHPDEVRILQKKPGFNLISLEAPIKIRFERMKSRPRGESDPQTFADFKKAEDKEKGQTSNTQNTPAVMEMAKIVVFNDKDVTTLQNKIERMLLDIKNRKREDYISWDDYFMGVAKLSAMRSKDPNTQVGACIVNQRSRIVGIGYNGFPAGCPDNVLPWAREGDSYYDTKYAYVAHAELNAILNSTTSLDNCRIYIALFPCNECAKLIIQSGIKQVIYMEDKYAHTDQVKAAKRMFDISGVSYSKYKPERNELVVDLKKS